jgi:hypothetical protein
MKVVVCIRRDAISMESLYKILNSKVIVMTETVYRLNELITKKFGEENFAAGCDVVANLLRGLNENFWIAEDIEEMCNITSPTMKLTFTESRLLCKFFKLNDPEELFNSPGDARFDSHLEGRKGYAAIDTSPPV